MRQHANLPAMVRFVSQHVAQHLHANRPGPRPPISVKLLNAPLAAERFTQHLRAASPALRQSRPRLLRRALRALKLSWNLQMRSRKPDPLRPDIVHMRKDRRNAAPLARRLGPPRSRIKLFNKNLIHPLIRGKDLHRGSPEWSVNQRLPIDSLTIRGLTIDGSTHDPRAPFSRPIILPRRRPPNNCRPERSETLAKPMARVVEGSLPVGTALGLARHFHHNRPICS